MALVPLWCDDARERQVKRLSLMQLQRCPEAGKAARAAALARRTGRRVPHWQTFAAVLGLYRTAVTCKDPMRTLELGLRDLARLTGIAKSSLALARTWLDELGWVRRIRRAGEGVLEGVRGSFYRTSKTFLTAFGEAGLGVDAVQRLAAYARRHARRAARWQKHYDATAQERASKAQIERQMRPPEPEPDEGMLAYGARAARHVWEALEGRGAIRD